MMIYIYTYLSLIFRSPIHSHFCSLEAQLESGVEGKKLTVHSGKLTT